MNPKAFIVALIFVAASALSVASLALAQEERQMLTPEGAQVLKAAPIYVVPDASRPPLRTAARGARLTVLAIVGEWYEVEWEDPRWGRRVGYIRMEFVRLDSQPIPREVPAPAPPPTMPTPPTPTPPQPAPARPEKPATPATAQAAASKKPVPAARRWADRGYISVSGIYQTGSTSFTESFSFDQYVEQANVSTEYPTKDQPGFDVGGAVRIWRGLAFGVAVTMVNWSTSASITGSIPHPFYFDADRPISGVVPVKRTETAVHLHALWFAPAGRKIVIALGGGPSYFNVKQSLVQSVSFTEEYPYDTAAFASASVNQPSTWALGYGAEADVGFYFTRIIGVGGGVRYARASVPLAGPSGSVKRDAGGLQGSVGLRIRLRQ